MSDLTDRAAAAVAQRKQGETATAAAPSIQQMLTQSWVVEQVQKQLGPGFDAGSYVRSVVSAIKNSPDLERCDPATIFGGMFTAAQMHLEIGGGLGQSWLIPRRNNKSEYGWEASFQIGYQGLLKLAYNTGILIAADTEIVRVGDKFQRGANSERGKFYDLEYGAEHENLDTPLMGVIGMFWTRGAHRPVWRYLTIDEIERRRPDHTKEQTGSRGTYVPNTPWKTDYQAMCEKTAMIHTLKWAPKSPHLALALNIDNQALSTQAEAPDEVKLHRDGEKPETIDLTATRDEAAKAGVTNE
ncbi:RecT-like DNA pairing protein [Microbacterium phage ValentiniPuff]|uniref:RecT-like DNA pairing protein n=1 Tax=Microbacterium phage ValentiniPuff TaxID=2315705 RepID=A0A386KPV8_9CAUD|nr:RecT-like DNA pairing protein [Microbacterium phage ValentiniPuff]